MIIQLFTLVFICLIPCFGLAQEVQSPPPRMIGVTAAGAVDGQNNPIKGVFVAGIIQGSPAQEAGLQVGDYLLSINNKDIPDVNGFVDIVRSVPLNQYTVNVVFQRSNSPPRELVIALAETAKLLPPTTNTIVKDEPKKELVNDALLENQKRIAEFELKAKEREECLASGTGATLMKWSYWLWGIAVLLTLLSLGFLVPFSVAKGVIGAILWVTGYILSLGC